MQWLADLEHHVVGDIHHVTDGSHACEVQPPLHPAWRRSDADAAHRRGGEARAALGIIDPHREQLVNRRRAWRACDSGRRRIEQAQHCGCVWGAEQRVCFASDAHHRHAVGSIGGDVDVEDRLVQKCLDWLTDRGARFEDVDAVFVGRDAQLVARAHHALRGDAAQIAAAHLGRGQPSASRDVRHDIADLQVRSASDDGNRGATQIHARNVERFAPRVRLQLDDPAERYIAPIAAHLVHVLHLEAGHGQPLAQRRQGHLDLDQLAQPAQWHLHLNCSRKRRSLA